MITNGCKLSSRLALQALGLQSQMLRLQLLQGSRCLFSTYRDRKNLKFSAYLGQEKDYSVDEWKNYTTTYVQEPFVPKPEYLPENMADPNIRDSLPEIPTSLVHAAYFGHVPIRSPISAYVSIFHNGQTYHLFNAEWMFLGRMAEMIAVIIRGKNKPTYVLNQGNQGEQCIVVNAAKARLSGKKKAQKIYRYHTGYPGGLKEIPIKDMLIKNPEKVIYLAVKGMVPKNYLREQTIEKYLKVFPGQYHNLTHVPLPQFGYTLPEDINQKLGLDGDYGSDAEILYESHPGADDVPELAGIKRNYDPKLTIPFHMRDRNETRVSRRNQQLALAHRIKHRLALRKHMSRYKMQS